MKMSFLKKKNTTTNKLKFWWPKVKVAGNRTSLPLPRLQPMAGV